MYSIELSDVRCDSKRRPKKQGCCWEKIVDKNYIDALDNDMKILAVIFLIVLFREKDLEEVFTIHHKMLRETVHKILSSNWVV